MREAGLKLHNAMWPGLVGKGEPGTEPFIGMRAMLELTAAAQVNGRRFDGVDFFMYEPHFDIHASEDEVRRVADEIAAYGFNIGSVVAPIWPDTLGASAMGSADDRKQFVKAVEAGYRAIQLSEEGAAETPKEVTQ
jgi:hypothetical protein